MPPGSGITDGIYRPLILILSEDDERMDAEYYPKARVCICHVCMSAYFPIGLIIQQIKLIVLLKIPHCH